MNSKFYNARIIAAALIVAAPLSIADEGVQILRAGLWHGDQVAAESGSGWWGVFPEGDGFTLQAAPVTVTREEDEIVDVEGEETGKRVRVPQEAEPVLLVNGIEGLKEGRLQTAKTPVPEGVMEPGQSLALTLDEDAKSESVELRATGTMITPEGQTDRLLESYQFILAGRRGGKAIEQTLATLPNIHDSQPRLVWAGDLDRDGRSDLLLDITDHYNVTHLVLFLSSAAKDGELVGKVAEWRTTGC